MPWRWGKRLLLRRDTSLPYRVLCIGSDLVYGRVGLPVAPYYTDSGTGFVERMAQRAGEYYVFMNAGAPDTTIKDFYYPEDPAHPGDPKYGGAYEMLVEPVLEARTGNKIDLAIIWSWWADMAKTILGGWFESEAPNVLLTLVAMDLVMRRLVADGVRKILVLTPCMWAQIAGGTPEFDNRISTLRDGIIQALENGITTVGSSATYLDVYTLLDQAVYFPGYGGPSTANRWLNQAGHDRLAAVVGRWIRQSTQYRFARPGGPGSTEPFQDWEDWQPLGPV